MFSEKNTASGKADPRAEIKKSNAASINDFLRPNPDASIPETALPITQPNNALETVAP
ncbi:hypothetical protein SDC9_139684 [bioreactor metagenome]|uniref:Uncharacterized protein n=1 Tax=bioreactor metagenome TaxID=1076179 RepID=A0A645DTE2_9ZZZZ